MQRIAALSLLLLLSCAGVPAGRGTEHGSVPGQVLDYSLRLESPRFGRADNDLYLAIVSKVFANEVDEVGGCFQMLSLEGPAPEELVYVDCSVNAPGDPSTLVHLVAETNIRNKLGNAGVDAAIHVGVRRSEVSLGFEDSRLLGEIWMKMIQQAKARSGLIVEIHEQERKYHMRVCEAGCLSALADNPHSGTPAAKLVEIGKLLAQLVDARAEDRPAFSRMIRAKAKLLALAVKSSEKGDNPRGDVRGPF